MTLSKLALRALPILIVGVLTADCTSTNLTPPKHDSGTDVPLTFPRDSGRDTAMSLPNDASKDAPNDVAGDGPITLPHDSGSDGAHGSGGCSGHAPTPSEVPPFHRATAAACAPTPFPYWAPDSGGTCVGKADCPSVPLAAVSTCLHGQCSPDQCLTDADCRPNEVCSCANPIRVPTGRSTNTCVPANCHVDADCGTGGYCSPTVFPCGDTGGYYCHGPQDTCVDGSKDCGCGMVCQYTPTTGGFSCVASNPCGG